MELEAFELVLLRRPANPTDYDDATLERIQEEHLDFLRDLRERELVVTNGPVLDQPDESLRGLAFYRTGSTERAAELANSDPAVIAGRLTVEVMTWWCSPGTMVKPGQRITHSP
jgi:uncharacterized protein YciI